MALELSAGQRVALAPATLGFLCKGLGTMVEKRMTINVGGLFWLFQSWLIAYFLTFQGSFDSILEGDIQSLGQSPSVSCFSFDKYFSFFYNVDRAGYTLFFLPFMDRSFPPNSSLFLPPFDNINQSTFAQLNAFWKAILVPRFIPLGFFHVAIVEAYTLNQLSSVEAVWF